MKRLTNERQLNVDLSKNLLDGLDKIMLKRGMSKKRLVSLYLRLGNRSEVMLPELFKGLKEDIDSCMNHLKQKPIVVSKHQIEFDPVRYPYDLAEGETCMLVIGD